MIFIHGFTGGTGTWRNVAGTSFKEMLEADSQLNQEFDFFEYEYFTKITAIQHSAVVQKLLALISFIPGLPKIGGKIKKNQTIANLSQGFSTHLRYILGDYSSVVVIAHSLGGLIAKDQILNYEEGNGPKVVGYVSLAVPHKGSLSALLLAPTSNINAKELVPLSEYSDELNNKWTLHRDHLPSSLYLIAQHDECVPKTSAIPFTVTAQQKAVVDHDHCSICKPPSREDLSYKAVRQFLKNIAHAQNMANTANTAATTVTPDYDKEIFVLKMIICDIGPKGVDDAKECFFNAEIISKAANKNDAKEMLQLQQKVLSIYNQKYNAFVGTKSTPNHVFAQIHSEITAQDSLALKSSLVSLNFLHKKGLLHQLANNMGETVVWSDDADYFTKIKKALV
ncbi:ABC-three component system protein [Polaromonas sp. CG_9.5]|uniref:ABC-three component system protein n=1 Tax=Polaromonas sp. CG_9.5 TaxID=3071705 RepID=UPI002E115725